MRTVHRLPLPSGIEIEYEDWGTGDRPLVLVHGFTGSRDDWREHLPDLAKLGRTLALDQRGHGGSTNTHASATDTLEQLADDLAAVDEAWGLDAWDLLGHSLGGMVALRLALARPDRVASLILMDTSPYGLTLAPRSLLEGGARFGRIAGMRSLAGVMREAQKRAPPLAPATRRVIDEMGEDDWWSRITAKIEQMDPHAFAALGAALSEQVPVTDRLGELRCPTTVIVGAEDTNFLAPSRALAEGIPGAVHVVLENACHNGQLEDPAAWLDAIRAHLARARGGTPHPERPRA